MRLAVVEDEINLLEWSANSKCGGGSGILIEKQLRRLYLKDDLKFFNIEDPYQKQKQMEQLFVKAESEITEFTKLSGFNARCGVIIQSDLIHEQNEGAQNLT